MLKLIIIIAVLALTAGGGFYIKRLQNNKSAIQTGLDAEKKAEQVVGQVNQQNQQQQNTIDALNRSSTSRPTGKPVLE